MERIKNILRHKRYVLLILLLIILAAAAGTGLFYHTYGSKDVWKDKRQDPVSGVSEKSEYLSSLFGAPHAYNFKSEYSGEDYDGDGLPDQAQIITTNDNTKTAVTVSFGNGDLAEFTESDMATHDFKLLGSDLNGDGANEIIILIDAGAQGGDGIYSVTVYEKQGSSYNQIPLPEQYSMDNGFAYALKWDGNTAKILDGDDNELITLNNDMLKEKYYRTDAAAEWDNLQGKAADAAYADGVCDAVIDTVDNKPYLMLKQYLIGPTGVHADCAGYMVTGLQLNADNSWEIAGAYYLPE